MYRWEEKATKESEPDEDGDVDNGSAAAGTGTVGVKTPVVAAPKGWRFDGSWQMIVRPQQDQGAGGAAGGADGVEEEGGEGEGEGEDQEGDDEDDENDDEGDAGAGAAVYVTDVQGWQYNLRWRARRAAFFGCRPRTG